MKINSCLLLALIILLVSYTLAARTQNAKGPEDENKVGAYGGGGGNYGGGGGNYGGGGGNYGGGGGGGHGGGGGGGGCYHGCCYRGHGGCSKCCSSPEEAKAFAEKQLNP